MKTKITYAKLEEKKSDGVTATIGKYRIMMAVDKVKQPEGFYWHDLIITDMSKDFIMGAMRIANKRKGFDAWLWSESLEVFPDDLYRTLSGEFNLRGNALVEFVQVMQNVYKGITE